MGEFEFLARLGERLGPAGGRVRLGFGDDAAVTVPGGATATSVDAVVEGTHFDRAHAGLAQIGHKALATALSDLAAMGAEPGEAYVALAVPEDMTPSDCLDLLEGMLPLADRESVTLAGGDTVRAPVLSLTVTVIGHAAEPDLFLTRSGACPGDRLLLTGAVGGAAAGLELLLDPGLAARAGLDPETADYLRDRQLVPCPRLAAGLALRQTGAGAMIDLSDGLGADAGHLSRCSQVRCDFDGAGLPLDRGVLAVAEALGLDPWQFATGRGEDYELLAAVAPARREQALQAAEAAGVRITDVGRVLPGLGVSLRTPDGREIKPSGYDQLAG